MGAFWAALKPRLFGAIGAGFTTGLAAYTANPNVKAALATGAATAASFIVYGGTHTATAAAANPDPSP